MELWGSILVNDKEYIDKLEDLIKYQYAYDILMKYWNNLPDEDKPKINKELKELGLWIQSI